MRFTGNQLYLIHNIGIDRSILEYVTILSQIRRSHEYTIQPHLVRIYQFVPETAFTGTGLFGQLFAKSIHRHLITPVSRLFIKIE